MLPSVSGNITVSFLAQLEPVPARLAQDQKGEQLLRDRQERNQVPGDQPAKSLLRPLIVPRHEGSSLRPLPLTAEEERQVGLLPTWTRVEREQVSALSSWEEKAKQ